MARAVSDIVCCQVCKQTKNASELISGVAIREAIVDEIKKRCPDWTDDSYICHKDLDGFRSAYVRNCLAQEKGELSAMEAEVIKSMEEEELLAKNVNSEFDSKLTFGQRVADKVAEFGGSWNFIGLFGGIIFVWIGINTFVLLKRPFDAYPFILLNLVLSCLAAIQAPVIMMSQNRAEAKDRMRGEHDYQVNLKAELEIRNLHEKMDHLLNHQWQRLLEIQQIQTDLMSELAGKSAKEK